MPYSDIYLYSPLSIKTVQEGHNKALLLQFILSELFHAWESQDKEDPLDFVFSSPACFFPYDWSYEVGCLNKILEHAKLLPHAFPQFDEDIQSFNSTVETTLSFVLKHKKENASLDKEQLCDELHQIYQMLKPFLISCKEDENLLLYLVKNSEEIQTLTKTETVGSLLAKMYPEGLDGIAPHIREQYSSRGFSPYIPEIEQILTHYE